MAGFVGIAERGPVQTPVKIESYRQFLTTFGERVADGYLAYAVSGFFENGGRTCWVVRAADPDQARPASARLQLPDRDPIDLEAVSAGEWGNTIEIEAVWGRDRVVLLGDQTLDTALGHSGWTRYVELLIERIRSGRARDGILEIIEQLEPQLAFIAPRTEGDINELPDAPIR